MIASAASSDCHFRIPLLSRTCSSICVSQQLQALPIEKTYSTKEFVAKLRRFADSLESGENFEIQVAEERIYLPDRAEFSIEHEREGANEELEFQIKWTNN